MDYFDISNQKTPAPGDILISNPLLEDPNFERSVIYLTEHAEHGSLGFIINQPGKVLMEDVVEGFEFRNVPVYIGGPVEQNTLHFIYKLKDGFPEQEVLNNSIPVRKNIYLGGDFEQLKLRLRSYGEQYIQIKFFIGYSGWSPGQLQKEIDQNSWVVVKKPYDDEIFENKNQSHWKEIMVKLGGRYRMMANYPTDPLSLIHI